MLILFAPALAVLLGTLGTLAWLYLVTAGGSRSPREGLVAWLGPLRPVLGFCRDLAWEVPLRVATGRYRRPWPLPTPVDVRPVLAPCLACDGDARGCHCGKMARRRDPALCVACGRDALHECNCQAPWKRGGAVPPLWWVDARTARTGPFAGSPPVVRQVADAIMALQALSRHGAPPRPELADARADLADALDMMAYSRARGLADRELARLGERWLEATAGYHRGTVYDDLRGQVFAGQELRRSSPRECPGAAPCLEADE